MPPTVTVQESLVNFLANGWRIKGHTQGLGYPIMAGPAPPTETALGNWWTVSGAGKPMIRGFVLFYWRDIDPPIGWPKSYTLPPWERETWTEKTFDAAALTALFGTPVVAGDSVGIRVQTVLQFVSGYYGVPAAFIELESEGIVTRFSVDGGWNLWTLPPGGTPDIQDAFLQLVLGPSVEITVRVGARRIAPSMNLSFTLDFVEFGLFPGPPPPEPPEPPLPGEPPLPPVVVEGPLTPCSIADVLMIAQAETGYRWSSKTEAARHLARYAKQLQSRCMAAWYGNEVADEDFLVFDLGSQYGWGYIWGSNWGGGVVPPSFTIPVPGLEAIWLVEARRLGETVFEPVNVMKPDDQTGALDPRCLIRDARLELLDFATQWHQVFDTVRIRATAVHPAVATEWTITLAPNEHIGPLFCRACELEMSRFLSSQKQDIDQQIDFGVLRDGVTRSLMSQSRSQGWIETSRGARR